MVATTGLVGWRPSDNDRAARVTSPPYDVIKDGSALQAALAGEPDSLYHVILGDSPVAALEGLRARGVLTADDEPAYYVYEQQLPGETRTGVFVAAEVTEYEEKQIVRHEKTFDEKVRGRIALAEATGLTTEPIFLLTQAALGPVLTRAKSETPPLYDFTSDFGAGSDLSGVRTRLFRVPMASPTGAEIQALLEPHPLYIADGHHRYHAALRGGHSHVLAYVTEQARILAYDRVVNGVKPFAEVRAALDLRPADAFTTPPKHEFRLYAKDGCWTLPAAHVPNDVVGRLDCSILERELYPHLGLEHRHIIDPKHFDYYPESALDEMKAEVDRGTYELAIALAPVTIEELMAVADAGLDDPEVVMPEKSTFFSPKILSGLILYRYGRRQ